jgi:hypothetical protein
MNTVVPALASIISLIFAIAVLDQFISYRKPYQMTWFLGLIMFFISTGAEFLAELNGPSVAVYKLWYIFGAVLVASYLGMGSIYLLISRRRAHMIMITLGIASIAAIIIVVASPVDFTKLPVDSPILTTGEPSPSYVRWMTPFFNTLGTIGLVGGAVYSAYLYRRSGIMKHKVVSSILIAVGGVIPALGGALSRYAGLREVQYPLQLLGILIIFIGFLRSSEKFGFGRIPLIHRFLKKS